MKKTLFFLVAAAIIGFWSQSNTAQALDMSNGTPGAPLDLAVATSGAPNFAFNPSTNVNIRGTSSPTSFAIYSWHQNVINKKSGQAFGMAADVNKLYFLDISSAGATAPSLTGTTSAVFTGWTTL